MKQQRAARELELAYGMYVNPLSYVAHTVENVAIEENRIVRTVEIRFDGSAMAKCDSLFVIRKPNKGQVLHFTLSEKSLNDGVRLMSHAEHIELSERLIGREFISHLHRLNLPPLNDAQTLEFEQQLSVEIEKLRNLAAADASAARLILGEVFTSDGTLASVAKIEEVTEHQLLLFSNPFDLDEANRLAKICSELADTYLVVARVPRGVHCLHYCDTHDFLTEGKSARGSVRRMAGALPYSYRIGVPLSAMSQQYDFIMDSPDGYYFDSERVLEVDEIDTSETPFAASRNWRPVKESAQYDDDATYLLKNISERVTVWRAGGSRTKARIVITDGGLSNGGISLGFVVAERPPGSTARTAIAILFSLFASVVIYFWLLLGTPPDSSVPNMSIMVAFLTVGASLSTEILPVSGFLAAPFVPRIMLGAHMVFGILFAIWILAAGGEVGTDDLRGFGAYVGVAVGPLLLVLSATCFLYLSRSWYRASARYNFVTNPGDFRNRVPSRLSVRYLRLLRSTL